MAAVDASGGGSDSAGAGSGGEAPSGAGGAAPGASSGAGADTTADLRAVATHLSSQLLSGSADGVDAFDRTIEDSFARVDETNMLVDSTQHDIEKLRNTVVPELQANSAKLVELFKTIDALEGFVDHVASCTSELKGRAGTVQKAFDVRHPNSMKRMMNTFKFMGNKSTANTAPIDIPEWDASSATFSTAEFFERLRESGGAGAEAADTEGSAGRGGAAAAADDPDA